MAVGPLSVMPKGEGLSPTKHWSIFHLSSRLHGHYRSKIHMKAGLKTFVVDDESVIAKTLEIILMQSGFEADSLTNPVLALESKV